MTFLKSRVLRPSLTVISLISLASVTAGVLFVALSSPLKDDIAWLLYVARRWQAGKELYVDVIEVNPPLIVWISAIPLTLARWLGVAQRLVALPFFAAIALGGAWWTACLLRPLGGLFARRAPVFAIAGSVLLIIPAADLGQREHLLISLILPYLVLFGRTLMGETPPLRLAFPVGIAAALGCALKPQYGLAFAALEGVALCRGLRPWRAAPLAAAVTLAGYVGLVAWLCPAYLAHAIPMALALYGATDVSFLALAGDCATVLMAEAVAVYLLTRERGRLTEWPLLLTGVVFTLASSLICFLDGKNWFYHRIPAIVVITLVLVLWAAAVARSRSFAMRRGDWLSLSAVTLAIGLFCLGAVNRLTPEVRQAVEPRITTVERLEALVRLHHARSYMAFSEWIALGFPVVNNTGVVWTSRFDSMWALKGELWKAHIDPVAARAWPIGRWVAHDFIRGCPDIVVVDNREPVNYIRILSAAEPAFAHTWAHYRQIIAFDGLSVYKRAKGGCVDPWGVAQGPTAGPVAIR